MATPTPIALLPRASIEPLVAFVDGYISERHSRRVRRSDYSVESGATLTDHAVREPDELTVEGWVSDIMPSREADQGLPLLERAAAAWAEIDHVMSARKPLTVVSLLATYTDMLLTGAEAPVDQRVGRALRFTLTLQRVQFADTLEEPGAIIHAATGPAADRVGTEDRGRVDAPNVAEPPPYWAALEA